MGTTSRGVNTAYPNVSTIQPRDTQQPQHALLHLNGA